MQLEIDYIEFQSDEYEKSKAFFEKAFGWSYVDYGPDYAEIRDAGVTGGLARANKVEPPLVILKTSDLEAALAQVERAGAEIVEPIFSFPGGRRFHFKEPGGNVMAIWSEH
ncbi:VOC family protein [Maritalea mediterranea]|uniref:VOC family protein n=1 Tax=Maritalea mediterranea TaxID=2909667 RepID=A0ABS9E9I3_9HYPH|nr:VOC family protein [Maritalea mediterranea]MCF4099516.1 VOC family protein [Maritalea mediterranea]